MDNPPKNCCHSALKTVVFNQGEEMPILRQWAEHHPDKTAALVAFSDEAVTYGELDRRANAVTQLLMWMGLAPGDGIAIMLDNDPTYFEIIWGARRHGVYYTPVSTHLRPDEAAYIVRDSGAKAFLSPHVSPRRFRHCWPTIRNIARSTRWMECWIMVLTIPRSSLASIA
jgi:acyl-coenzyme A synthetase/AMP-(fatty) acid ligase